jgi:hypothetical protein
MGGVRRVREIGCFFRRGRLSAITLAVIQKMVIVIKEKENVFLLYIRNMMKNPRSR